MIVMQMPLASPFFRMVISGCRTVRVWMRQDKHGSVTAAHKRALRVGALGLAFWGMLGLNGCHTLWPFDQPAALLDSAQFMTAWKVYLHCRSSIELEEIRADLQQLNRVVRAVSPGNHATVLLFPAPIRTLIAALPSRLAVDPQAMSAACALHGSQVAQTAGQPELSVEWLTEVAAHEGWASSHYAVQAGHQLKRME